MKKSLTILVVLLANILMLAHTVVPHHHHNTLVCVDNSHCGTDAESHNHDAEENHHRHDGENGTELCVFKQDIVLRSGQLKKEMKCLVCLDNYPGFVEYQDVLFDAVPGSLISSDILIALPPLLFSSYSRYACRSMGMRAPPLV